MWFIEPLLLSVKLAIVSTCLLLLLVIPFAWWLAIQSGWFKRIIESCVCLPLVLPPSVLGFYCLIFFNPQHGVGWLWHKLTGGSLLFNFSGLVVASMIYSVPFVIQPILNAYELFHERYTEPALSLGLTSWTILFHLAIPVLSNAILRGALLGFAHTLGEFGVVLMLGGNIPGKTQVASVAIYTKIEQLQLGSIYSASFCLLLLGFMVMLLSQYLLQSTTSSTQLIGETH